MQGSGNDGQESTETVRRAPAPSRDL